MKFGKFSIAGDMESRIGADILRAIGRAAEETGAEAYLVGGLPRDIVAGFPPGGSPDVDITLVGIGRDGFDEIARRVGGEIVKRSQFGTVALRVGERDFDLVMARDESYASPGSLPVVRRGTLAEDLARRDFSVNAMAVSLSDATWGELYDPQGGLDDLRNGTLRVLHPDSFRDDATRILRAARYSSRLSLRLSAETREALGESVGYISCISSARVRDELERVFLEPDAPAALGLLQEWGALSAIHPALGYDAAAWGRFSERAVGLSERGRIAVGYAILGAGTSVTESVGVAARITPGARARRALLDSAGLMARIEGGEFEGAANSAVAEALDALSELGVMGCAIARAGSAIGGRLEEYLRVHRPLRTILTGDDIISLGVARGPEVGRVQRRLRAARQDGLITSGEEEEAFVLDMVKASRE